MTDQCAKRPILVEGKLTRRRKGWGFIRRVYHCAKRPTWVEGKLTSWQRVWGLVKLFHDGNDKIWSPAKYSTTKSRDCNHHGIQSCIHIYISWPHFRKKIINWVWRSIYMESTRHARTNYYRVDDSNTTLWKLGHDHTWIWIKQHFHPVLWSCEVPPLPTLLNLEAITHWRIGLKKNCNLKKPD